MMTSHREHKGPRSRKQGTPPVADPKTDLLMHLGTSIILSTGQKDHGSPSNGQLGGCARRIYCKVCELLLQGERKSGIVWQPDNSLDEGEGTQCGFLHLWGYLWSQAWLIFNEISVAASYMQTEYMIIWWPL